MTKTKILVIITAAILVAGVLALTPSEQAEAKPSKVGFGFVADDFSGPGPPLDIVMTGGGVWTSGTMKIKASGGFTIIVPSTTPPTIIDGTWKAKKLTDVSLICPPCAAAGVTTTGPGVVVFTAKFTPDVGPEFTRDVVVADGVLTTDIAVAPFPTPPDPFVGQQTFFVQNTGFGTAFSTII